MNIQEENSAHYLRVQSEREQTLDSLSITELDTSGQLEALRVSPSQVLTSPSLFQQGLPGELLVLFLLLSASYKGVNIQTLMQR